MTTLISIAAAAGLVAVSMASLFVAGYGLLSLIRLLRHWDTTMPPPALRSGRIAGVELQLGDTTGSTQDAIRRLEGGLKRLEVTIFRLSDRVLTLERRLLTKPNDDRT